MRIFHFHQQAAAVAEIDALPKRLPDTGFFWIACERQFFEHDLLLVQSALQTLCGASLMDLHVSDLLNPQLTSHFEDTSQYSILVFRRLAAGSAEVDPPLPKPVRRSGPPVLRRIDTRPVGFVVFDRLLLTVHPSGCSVLRLYAERLLASTTVAHMSSGRAVNAGLPASPADLMLRIVDQMVDGYLALRRDLTRQLDHWQAELLHPSTRFNNWSALLDARISLHQLDEICEDQRAAIQDWIEALAGWDVGQEGHTDDLGLHKGVLEQLKVRSRDVLEHIERVTHHVRRLEQNAEIAVQMHFSAQSNRTNDIMRTLTALTAIFLPLNLIAGIFGMNFDFIPLLHDQGGFWWAMGTMLVVAVVLTALFWRKRYLARTGH